MPTINSVDVKITGDESGLKKATNEAQKDISKVGTSALSLGKIALGTGLGQLFGNVIAGAVRMVTQELDGAIERLDTINNYSKVMGNLGIGADDSAKSIDYLQEHLLGLPTSLNDAALAVQRFTSVNKDIKASTVGFLALNNAILAGGAPMETQATALEQIAQAYSKGKPDAMEWRAMLTAMPAQMNQIAKAAGYSSAVIGGDFYNAIQNGKFSMNDFMATVVKLNTKGVDGFANFEEQARNATGGVQTSIANLKNAMQRGIATVLDTIGQANIAGFINGIASAIGTVANYIAAFVRLIKEAVSWLGVLFGFKTGGAEATAKQTKDTATNLGASADNANATAKGINNATKAAKKLNNQLAGFDEMNVLRENKASGSGSGGSGAVGSGSFAVPEVDWNTNAAKKKESEVEKILEKFKKAFSKLGKAIEPVARVIADVWKNYLAPFFNWAGNDLLPAFFNAVGGALELIGTVIERIWSVALKPFVDGFLVPIAQFTGGIIVSVLNGIGNALSWIAGQKDALTLLTQIATTIGVVIAGIYGWNAAATLLNGVLGNFINIGLPTILENTKLGMAGITAGANAFTAAQGAATTATTVFGNIANAVFSTTTITMGALAAAVLAVKTVIDAFKLATMQAEAAENLRITAVKKETEATQMNSDAVKAQVDLKNQLKDLELELADANIALLNAQKATANAQKNATSIAKQYGMTTEEAREYVKGLDLASNELTEKDRQLAQAIYELESAQGRQNAAAKKVTETIDEQKFATEQLDNQQWKEIATQKEAEMAAQLAEGKYKSVAEALKNLANSSGEFKLKNGEMVKFTKQDMKDMADFIGQQMAQINSDSGKAWNKIWTDAEHSADKVSAAAASLVQNAENSLKKAGINGGKNFAAGVETGVKQGQGGAVRATTSLGSTIFSAFKNVLGIHSPSRVMAEAGRYLVEGIEVGMDDQEGSLIKTTKSLGNAITTAFNASAQLPELTSDDMASKLDAVASRAQARLTVNSENTAGAIESLANAIVAMQEDKQPIVVKVGEETLVDTIVEGINNASTMRNRGVINI